MAVKEVLLLGNPLLRRSSEDISDFASELFPVCSDLQDTLPALQKRKNIGRALAAPQIGYRQKVVYVNMPERRFFLVNPEITWKSEETFHVWDSCFSFDVAFFVFVERWRNIEVRYATVEGVETTERFEDDMAELLQHEIDHLHGVLATDRVTDAKNIVMREEWEQRYR